MIRYTDLLVATASGKDQERDFLVNLQLHLRKPSFRIMPFAAMAPSMRLQSFLTKEIQAVLEPDENIHLYKEWMDSLASKIYEASVSQIEELLDKSSVCLTGEELQYVETIYHKAMKLQVDFYSTQLIIQNTIVPLYRFHGSKELNVVMCSGFDMTCSAVDSCSFLLISIIKSSKAVNSNGYESLADGTLLDNRAIWSSLRGKYVREYEQCIDSIILNDRVMEFNFETLCKALGDLSDLEKVGNSRIASSGVLKGLHMDDIKWAGEHLANDFDFCLDFVIIPDI